MSIRGEVGLLEALNQVHSDGSELEWVVAGYSSKDVLDVIATGTSGALTAVSEHFTPDGAVFALIRYPLLVDNKSANTRFAFIDWTPDTMNPMKKAMVSVHKGQIRTMFGQFHVDLVCSDLSDVSEELIMKRIGVASGTWNNIVGAETTPVQTRPSRSSSASRPTRTPSHQESVNFSPDLKSFLETVRAGSNTWIIAGYDSEEMLVPQQSGQGSLDDLLTAIDRDQVQYALATFSHSIDEKATAQRFVYVYQMPSSMSPMKRGKLSIHAGSVSAFFKPFHLEFSIGSADELSTSRILESAQNLSGTRSHVVERASPRPRGASSGARLSFGGPASGAAFKYATDQENLVKSGIQAVHSDLGGCDWILCKVNEKDELTFVAQGQGGYDQLISSFEPERAYFAFLRVSDQIDRYLTTKFVLVTVVPENMSPMRKAKFGTMSGAIKDLFRPFHVDLVVSDCEELNEKEIQLKVGNASGSHSNVVQK